MQNITIITLKAVVTQCFKRGTISFQSDFSKICFDAQNTLLNDLLRAPVNMRFMVFSELCVIAIQNVKFFQMHTKPGFCRN